MKNFVLALSLFTSMISSSFAEITFSDAEAPYVTLERAYNTAQTFSTDVIKTLESNAASKVILLNTGISPETTLHSIGSASLLYLYKETKKLSATPARGPLFPAQPERISLTGKTLLCSEVNCPSKASYVGEFTTSTSGETIFTIALTREVLTFRSVGNAIVAKIGNKYLYGWIE